MSTETVAEIPLGRNRFRPVVAALTICAAVAACSGSDNTTSTIGTASATVEIVSGDGQLGAVGSSIGAPLIVKVVDVSGLAIAGAQVTFTASGGATIGNPSVTTDISGMAQTTYAFGTLAGSQTVTASVSGGGGPATFTLTASPGAALTIIEVSGDGQMAKHGTLLPSALVVQATDQYGNAVPNATVNWTTTAGTLSAQATTDANGMSQAQLTLPGAAGSTSVTATLGNSASSVSFFETST